ncbi:MAG: pyrroline-5-carboxylate reductase [Candidatus Omnitrophica bacterium]|nr:pyrroline-5-carboxylate reductase [Candidatus Omnitrophota bacterium]
MALALGIIGYGTMGSAIGEQLKARYPIYAFDKEPLRFKNIEGITVTKNLEQIFSSCTTVFLAVKPQDFESLLSEIKDLVRGQLLVSIAAGVSTRYIENRIRQVRVIRVMPNLAITVAAGMSCLTKGSNASNVDLSFIQGIFNRLGKTLLIEERMMNQATAVSGSGPGFFFDLIRFLPKDRWREFGFEQFLPALEQAASKLGFGLINAKLLSEATVEGSLSLLDKAHKSPEILCMRVASRGGTTEAGLKVLSGDIKNLEKAVMAAKKRADELSSNFVN